MPDTRFITEFDQYLFGQGTHYDLYNKTWRASYDS